MLLKLLALSKFLPYRFNMHRDLIELGFKFRIYLYPGEPN